MRLRNSKQRKAKKWDRTGDGCGGGAEQSHGAIEVDEVETDQMSNNKFKE